MLHIHNYVDMARDKEAAKSFVLRIEGQLVSFVSCGEFLIFALND